MIPHDALNNALRSLGYEFKRQADRVMIWKKAGDTRRVAIRRNTWHDEEYVRTVLSQAGMDQTEIERFIKEAHRSRH